MLVSDSQRFVKGFDLDLSAKLQAAGIDQGLVKWRTRFLPDFTGSGVAIDEDQTYSVKARLLWVGLEEVLQRVNAKEESIAVRTSRNANIHDRPPLENFIAPFSDAVSEAAPKDLPHEDFIAPFEDGDDGDL